MSALHFVKGLASRVCMVVRSESYGVDRQCQHSIPSTRDMLQEPEHISCHICHPSSATFGRQFLPRKQACHVDHLQGSKHSSCRLSAFAPGLYCITDRELLVLLIKGKPCSLCCRGLSTAVVVWSGICRWPMRIPTMPHLWTSTNGSQEDTWGVRPRPSIGRLSTAPLLPTTSTFSEDRSAQ